MDARQTANGLAILRQVAKRAKAGAWTFEDAKWTATLAIQCAMTESNLYNYANVHVRESMLHAHDAVGQDHDSVGLFQQRTPMWGPVSHLMDPARSTDLFLDALLRQGLTRANSGASPRRAIQAVQVSAYPDGSNYARNRARALAFRVRYFPGVRREVGYP